VGGIVKAFCACGYEKKMHLGGGLNNFKTYCNFPFYCRNCTSLVEINVLEQKKLCPQCSHPEILAYDDKSLCIHTGIEIFSWNFEAVGRELVLTDGRYLCPHCHKFAMSFRNVGDWD
jgi:hypothetical protein